MRKIVSCVLAAVLCLLMIPDVRAVGKTEINGRKYNIEVCTVDLFEHTSPITGQYFRAMETVSTTGRKEKVEQIELKYDFEEEKPERMGRFLEDAPVVFVKVDGFCKGLSAVTDKKLPVILVDGKELKAEGADYEQDVGWQNIGGKYGVVFPLELTKEGSCGKHTVQVSYASEEGILCETAEFTVKLTNTHEYKAEKKLRIVNLECEGADAYLLGKRLYIDHPKGTSGGKKIRITFAKENGSLFSEIAWAQETESEGGVGALSLGKETRLDKSKADFSINQLATAKESTGVIFRVETKTEIYESDEISVSQRFQITPEVLKGVRFQAREIVLKVGEEIKPKIVEIEKGKEISSGLWYTVMLQPSGDIGVGFAEEDRLLGVRPGEGVLRAKVISSDGKMYETGSVKVRVQEGKGEAYVVSCRKLNVRAGAGIGFARVGLLTRGSRVEVVKVLSGWALLSDGNFVCMKYLCRA